MSLRSVVAGMCLGGALAHGGLATEQVDAFEQVKRIGRGVNILGYDPIWDDFAKARFREKHFKVIRDAGFRSVRINLYALDRMDSANRLSQAWLSTLDWAVKNALENDLTVILDLHDFTDISNEPTAYKARLMAFWSQIVVRFKDAPSNVLFEVLNEPNGKLTAALWNEYLKEALAIIRKSNPTRTVVIGPPEWNGIAHLRELELPAEDRNLIVSVHYYEPMTFTHQGFPWLESFAHVTGIKWGSEAEKRKVEQDFAGAERWAKAHNRRILLGEFGAYDKGDMESRARYVAHVARTAESLGWAWTYWQFDKDFIVYDIEKDEWVMPILKALMP